MIVHHMAKSGHGENLQVTLHPDSVENNSFTKKKWCAEIIYHGLKSQMPASEKCKALINYFSKIALLGTAHKGHVRITLPLSISFKFYHFSLIACARKKTLRKGCNFSTLRKVPIQLQCSAPPLPRNLFSIFKNKKGKWRQEVKQSKHERLEKNLGWQSVLFCCQGQCAMQTLCLSCNNLCLQKDRQAAPLARWMFNLRKLKSQPPAWRWLQRHCQHNQFNWAGLRASISEEAVQHSGASCLMKQVAVVIKNPVLPYKFGHGSKLWPFSLGKGPTLLQQWDGEETLIRRIQSHAVPLETQQRPRHGWLGLSINVDQDSAIFLPALQNKPQN